MRRLFHMRLRFAPGVAMTGWDTYADGAGQMRGKLFGTIPWPRAADRASLRLTVLLVLYLGHFALR